MQIDGLTVHITRKAIKNLYLRVRPPDGRVEISAPAYMSQAQIEAFVCSKAAWIRRQQALILQRSWQREGTCASGERLYLWGVPYCLQCRRAEADPTLVLEKDRAILTMRDGSTPEQRTEFISAWYRALLKQEISELLPKWEKTTGLHPACWQIRNMRTRWGSCNVRPRKIWLSLLLAERPKRCLEYVILHELVHLQVPGHGADFKAKMDQFMPNWREIRKILNGTLPDGQGAIGVP